MSQLERTWRTNFTHVITKYRSPKLTNDFKEIVYASDMLEALLHAKEQYLVSHRAMILSQTARPDSAHHFDALCDYRCCLVGFHACRMCCTAALPSSPVRALKHVENNTTVRYPQVSKGLRVSALFACLARI